jgi:hypothetical protein
MMRLAQTACPAVPLSDATGWRPEVKNITLLSSSIYNDWRMEDVWLDR